MKTTEQSDKLARLPKWAAHEIRTLREENAMLRKQVAGKHPGTDTYIEGRYRGAVRQGPDIELPKGSVVTFKFGPERDQYASVRVMPDMFDNRPGVQVMLGGLAYAIPASGNVLHVGIVRRSA